MLRSISVEAMVVCKSIVLGRPDSDPAVPTRSRRWRMKWIEMGGAFVTVFVTRSVVNSAGGWRTRAWQKSPVRSALHTDRTLIRRQGLLLASLAFARLACFRSLSFHC